MQDAQGCEWGQGERREKEVVYMGAYMSCTGCVQAKSRYLEDEWDSEENPMCCLAALLCQSNAKQL